MCNGISWEKDCHQYLNSHQFWRIMSACVTMSGCPFWTYWTLLWNSKIGPGNVVCWLCASPVWSTYDLDNIRWQSCSWEVPNKIAAARLSWSQIGCSKFVPSSWSRCWWAGINNGVVPGFTNNADWWNYGCVSQQGTITKAVAWSCASLASTLPTVLNEGKIYELRLEQQNKDIYMICIWVRFVWCILSTFAIQMTSKQIYFWFPKLIKKGFSNHLVYRPFFVVVKTPPNCDQ